MKIETYKRTRIKKELIKAKEMLEEIRDNEQVNTPLNTEKPKKKRLTCVELKKEILDLHDKKMKNE